EPVTRRVHVETRIRAAGADARNAGLLPAEPADRRDVAAHEHSRRLHSVAVGGGGADRPLNEDLILSADRRGGPFLPGDPRSRLVRIDGRAAGHRGVLGVLVGMDVQGRNRDGATAEAAILPGKDPLALVGVAAVVKPAGEDVVAAEPRSARQLVPGRPRNGAARAGEIDRRRLPVLALV